ncbi:MAG: pyruvate kinase [Pseudomonadota bacterium]
MTRARFCKIVATVGPASSAPSMLDMLHTVGVDGFRLNFSHGDHETHGTVLDAIRDVEKKSGRPICVFADMQGPKFRCGRLPGGKVTLGYRDTWRLIPAEETGEEGVIPVPHPQLLSALQIDDLLMLDDGKLRLRISGVDGDMRDAVVEAGGPLSDRKGVNVPSRSLPVSALTDKDRADLAYALSAGVDYIALSFVQKPEDVAEAREIIGDKVGIISKIEKPSAVQDIEKIVALSDAIMVARGDLGVELPPERVPLIQRQIVRACRRAGKPVIVATHMLESMVDAPTPTRAEASDVATAVLQGADAVMLSAETAVGRHPPTAVAIMDRIIKAAEADEEYWHNRKLDLPSEERTTADAISSAASSATEPSDVTALIAYTETGSTARRVSRDRPRCPIIALTPHEDAARRLRLGWGLEPHISPNVADFEGMIQTAEDAARMVAGAQDGERIVIVTGYPFGRPGKTNTLKISRLGAA